MNLRCTIRGWWWWSAIVWKCGKAEPSEFWSAMRRNRRGGANPAHRWWQFAECCSSRAATLAVPRAIVPSFRPPQSQLNWNRIISYICGLGALLQDSVSKLTCLFCRGRIWWLPYQVCFSTIQLVRLLIRFVERRENWLFLLFFQWVLFGAELLWPASNSLCLMF